MDSYRRYVSRDVLEGGLIGLSLSMLDMLSRYNFPVTKAIVGFLAGCLIVLMNHLVFMKLEYRINHLLMLLLKILIINIISVILVSIFGSLLIIMGLVDGADNPSDIFTIEFLFKPTMVSFQTIVLLLIYYEVRQLIGKNVLENYIIGRYRQPKTEEKIVMFIDMKSSTTYAEILGNKRYYRFLNEVFKDTTIPLIKNDAFIYKYIGDEMILIWTKQKGLENLACLRVHFDIAHALELRRAYYESEYGCFPEFKAGVHLGEVTVAEIGQLKKEISYNGDVMNTAARIQSKCNQYHAGLLVSADVVYALSPGRNIEAVSIGSVEFKGKSEMLELYEIKNLDL